MSVDNRGTTDVPRWYYSFMIRGVRYFGSIPEARTKAEALKVEAMKRLEVYEGRYGKEPGVKDFCEFVDQVYMEYAKSNKATWKHDLFRSETLKEHFGGLRFRDITPRSVEKFILGRLDSDSRRKSKRSPVSVHKEFSLLSSIFNMAMREEVAACNPCLKISKKVREKIPARNKRDRFMSLEEEDKLFNFGTRWFACPFSTDRPTRDSPWSQTWRTHGNQTGRHQPQYEAFLREVEEQGTGCEG